MTGAQNATHVTDKDREAVKRLRDYYRRNFASGASLNIVTAGEYVNVTTADGVTGWLNKKYCKASR